jgi:hypothetical protein
LFPQVESIVSVSSEISSSRLILYVPVGLEG